ncbi:hypothetical protein ISN76_13070 [Dyella halodurans]|uniref:Transcriptional regulator n=1 Tax=Dyella halodurans TaxID=1920171 RepID=A0ABV9C1M9_9GAMM|nr:hypothetical protein [Dyella halodurans]
MANMKPDGKLTSVLNLLKEGPGTTRELAIELEIPSRSVGALLCDLKRRKKITSEPFVRTVGKRPVSLWRVVEQAA